MTATSNPNSFDRLLIATLFVLAILFLSAWYIESYLKAAAISGCRFRVVRWEPHFELGIAPGLGASKS